MYYATDLFVRRGPLATLWLAGSLQRKVTKQQIQAANIQLLCDVVSAPPVSLALPTQSTLLRGVVRIENRKSVYLLEDAELTTGRLTQPRMARQETTVEPKKIKAKHDTITLTDRDTTLRTDEQFGEVPMDYDPVAMLLDETGQMDDLFQHRLDSVEEAVYKARPEDITMSSQDLGGIMMDESYEFGSFDQDIAMDDFGMEAPALEIEEALLQIPGVVPPSPAISAMTEGEEMDLLTMQMRAKQPRKKGKKVRAYVPAIDEITEIGDSIMRRNLHDVSDIRVSRPQLALNYRMVQDIQAALQQPATLTTERFANVPQEFIHTLQSECRVVPIVDVAGHTPSEIEAEFGGERGWEMEEGEFGGGDISEGREREFDISQMGIDQVSLQSLDEAIDAGIGVDESALFGAGSVESQIEEGRRARRVSKGIQIVSEMETPPIELPESEFALEMEVEKEKVQRPTIERRAVNKHTEIFRNAIEKKFSQLSRQRAPMSIEFDSFLMEIVNGAPTRRDRALAFYQLLVLHSLEVIQVEQTIPMGKIIITKGNKYTVRWSSSQMFGSSQTPSQ